MAQWITNAGNPLTTRSIVNRVWQYHLGRGLAVNANNFEGSGGKPTHPELLDWLTTDFVNNGWKFKHLHRLVMTSEAYKQDSERHDMKEYRESDPNNQWLGYFEPHHLTAAEIRDSMLTISGELNRDMGGVPAIPEINMEVALQPRMIQFSIAPVAQPSRTPSSRNRRSIYTYRVRGQADLFLEVFNQPNPNGSCKRRDSPSVSPQALTLMNSDIAADRSIAFALRIEQEVEGITNRIDRAYQLAYGRVPSEERRQKLIEFLQKMQEQFSTNPPVRKTYPTRVTRSLVEEFSGKPFQYEEWLNQFEDYLPDKKAWQIEPGTRSLAELCLLLCNSNEFIYVY